MPTIRRKLVTIITEAVLESELLDVLDALGASGYTVTNARGKGSRGIRDAGWTSSGNVRIEVICTGELAATIAGHLHENYYNNYAMVVYQSDVSVLREGKFS
ncbi:MAG: transcriptional regulator [Proteobacteria bacterium]|nr:transcriptional regulator [Pseudomonadota bacterium]